MSPRDSRTSRHSCSVRHSSRSVTRLCPTMVMVTCQHGRDAKEPSLDSLSLMNPITCKSTVIANYYAAKLAIAKASKDNRAFIDELLNVLEKVVWSYQAIQAHSQERTTTLSGSNVCFRGYPGLNSNARILETTRLSRTTWWDMHISRTLPSKSLARPMTRTTKDSRHSTLGIYHRQGVRLYFAFLCVNHSDIFIS